MVLRKSLIVVLVAASAFAQAPEPPKTLAERLDGPPIVSAKAWAIADGATGKFLWGGNETEARPIASTTKVMTAWLVLQLADKAPKVLDETLTYSARAAATPGTSAKLKAGERLPVRELLYGLMLPSGNDAAVAFAEHFGPRLGGDEDAVKAFVGEMNRRAQALGLANTSYQDPNGLSPNNKSSARDLATLAWTAMKDARFREYVRTRRHDCEVDGPDGKRTVTWANTNKLLDIDGYDGVKTGTTTPAGNCLIGRGERGGDQLIVVILGSTAADGRYVDARNLFRWAWRERDKPLAGATIVVDPGHGGQRYSKSYTGGTRGVNSKLTESELNLRVAFELARQLKEKGATVHMTRVADHRLSREGSSKADELHARIDFFETHNPHFFLSVHHNAGRPGSGHTTLYKHNATDDTLYESLARTVNDTLEGAVPGPKLKLIKDNYHILRETSIPGTITESGFMTNTEFDELSTKSDYPAKEAAAICEGAVKYWREHKDALISLRTKLAEARANQPRDPKSFTAIDLNPDFRAKMTELLAKVAPGGGYSPAKAGEYVEGFKTAVVTDPAATFTVKAESDGKRVKLSGEVSDRKYHDQLIDMFVAMKLYDMVNEIKAPKAP
ncbi:MAG: N-acetylmuramoyl-L-alanine amidase [Gemmataceae bacterium]